MDDRALQTQLRWAALPIRERLRVLAKARNQIAADPQLFLSEEGGLSRKTPVEALSSEVLPLLAALRFLEESAEEILRPRKPGNKGLPLWMRGTRSEVHRVPFGKVLIIGPSNYPLFLAGLQTAQALAAGNAVIWKPGTGGLQVAQTFAKILASAGLPEGLLTVTDESVAAAEQAIAAGVDKVFLTGSATSGRALLRQLADRLIPAVVELSGCDAVIVLPGADLDHVIRAITFGIRLNGSCTCMAPRRLLLVGVPKEQKARIVERLVRAFQAELPGELPRRTKERLSYLLEDAQSSGAVVHGALAGGFRPILIDNGHPAMAVAQEDIFAPVITQIELRDEAELLAAQAQCPFGLTASVFGPEEQGRRLAEKLDTGTVFLNDVIFPSADPRVPFGGRRQSGFGVTQGAEGLLEMTAVKTVSIQGSKKPIHLGESKTMQVGVFVGLIRTLYVDGLSNRLRGVAALIREFRGAK